MAKTTNEKKAEAARKALRRRQRGLILMPDPLSAVSVETQKRIDRVVARALKKGDTGDGVDVIRDARWIVLPSRARKVG